MSDIATKLTYLDTTREKIKESINITGVGITEQDTFRSYEHKLKQGLVDIINKGTDEVYENFPKVSGSGSDISLENTYECKMKIDMGGDTEQDSTTGKNLWGGFTYSRTTSGVTFTHNEDGSILANGTATSVAYSLSSSIAIANNYTIILTAGTYTIGTGTENVYINVVDTTGTNISGTNSNNLFRTFTINEDTECFVRLQILANITVNNVLIKVMLEKNSTPTDYEPYTNGASPNPDYPQPINVVSGRQEVSVVGKNLLPPSIATTTQSGITLTNNEDGSYTLNGTATDNYTFSIDLPSTLNGTYSISCNNSQTSSSVSFRILNSNSSSLVSVTLISANTIRENVSITNGTKQAIRVASGTTLTNFVIKPQLEKGSQATPYKAFESQNYQINLGKNLFDKDNANIFLGYVNVSNVITSDAGTTSIYIPCQSNTTYTIQKTGGSVFSLAYCDNIPTNGDTARGRILDNTASSLTITTDSTAKYLISAICATNDSQKQQILDSIQIEKGNQKTSYSPYFTPIELCKIGDYRDRIKKSTGKNLFQDNYIFRPNSTRINAVLKRGTYTISTCDSNNFGTNLYFRLFDDNNNIITTSGHLTSTALIGFSTTSYSYYGGGEQSFVTFTIDNDYKLNIGLLNSDDSRRVILVEGSGVEREYEPYGHDFYIKKEIGKVVLDGSESGWTKQTSYYQCALNLGAISGQGYTNYYSYANSGGNTFYLTTNTLRIRDNTDTLENYKIWLSTHNIILYYVLGTPTYEIITQQNYPTLYEDLTNLDNAISYNEKTYISVQGNLPSLLEVVALGDSV